MVSVPVNAVHQTLERIKNDKSIKHLEKGRQEKGGDGVC